MMLFASLMTVDNLQVDKMIENIQKSILPTKNEVQHLIRHSKSIFYTEPNVLTLTGNYYIVGDIHGQFYDLLNIFKITDFDHSKKYLFLGDIVDRGYNSVETIILLLLYKVKYPSNIYIIRGNHETREATSNYGFMTECKAKLGLVAYLEFCSLFDYLPLCAVINNDIFCVHGGIVPDMDLNDLNDKFRLEDDSVHEMFWSDPSEDDGFAANPRGAGYLFGELQDDQFMQKHNLKKIVRSHQLVMEGYKEYYSGKLVTIWSAPNYCYVSGNIACVMEVKENNEFRYICFDAVENQK